MQVIFTWNDTIAESRIESEKEYKEIYGAATTLNYVIIQHKLQFAANYNT